MNSLLDAQLPWSLVRALRHLGHQVQHTFDLPDRSRSTDASICAWAYRHAAIAFSKDADLVPGTRSIVSDDPILKLSWMLWRALISFTRIDTEL